MFHVFRNTTDTDLTSRNTGTVFQRVSQKKGVTRMALPADPLLGSNFIQNL